MRGTHISMSLWIKDWPSQSRSWASSYGTSISGTTRTSWINSGAERAPNLHYTGPGAIKVVLLPITHTPPAGSAVGIEIPAKVADHLGLDHERSWVIVSECNVDTWPSPDLRPVPGSPNKFYYGFLPPKLFDAITARFREEYCARRVLQVPRTP